MEAAMTIVHILIVIALQSAASSAPRDISSVEAIVQQIRRADYEGDRAQLERLHAELEPFVNATALSSRVRYWRGFAMWRRALNGFNDGVSRNELDHDLTDCVADFRAALEQEPAFADAKAGAASCLVNNSFLIMKTDAGRARGMFEQSRALLNDALATDASNPRVLWVLGANQYYGQTPDGKARGIETYERGLALARAQNRRPGRLDPTWGEPELLMNLAFANLNNTSPDLDAAAHYVEQALELVPYWHYVRDVLSPAIQKARSSRANHRVPSEPAVSRRADCHLCTIFRMRVSFTVALLPGMVRRAQVLAHRWPTYI
jgi:hypothetical protein